MPLLNLDNDIKIIGLQSFFKIETGLNISFLYLGKEIDRELTFRDFCRTLGNDRISWMLRPHFDLDRFSTARRLFFFDLWMEVEDINAVFRYYYEIEIKIYDSMRKEAPLHTRLMDIVPESIKYRKIDLD